MRIFNYIKRYENKRFKNLLAYHGSDEADKIRQTGFKTLFSSDDSLSFAPYTREGYKTALSYTKPRSKTMQEYGMNKGLISGNRVIKVNIINDNKWASQPLWSQALVESGGNKKQAVAILKAKGYRGVELYKTIPDDTLRKMYSDTNDKDKDINYLREKGAQYAVFYPEDIQILK